MKRIRKTTIAATLIWIETLYFGAAIGFAQRTPVDPPPSIGYTWSEKAPGKTSVDTITPDSPIADSGLKANDVIVSINGKKPATGAEMERILRSVAAGEKAIIRVNRGDKTHVLTYAPPPAVKASEAKAGVFGAMVKMDDRGRIVVAEVNPDTPASKAGLKAGDVVQRIGEKTPTSLDEIVQFATRTLVGKRSGDRIDIKLLRGEREQVVILTLGEPQTGTPESQPNIQVVDQVPIVLGISVNERGKTLLVSQVIPNEPAAKAGLQPNDAILAVGKTPITSYASLARAIKNFKPGDQVPLQVQRGDQTAAVIVTVGTRRSSVADVMVDANLDIAEIVGEVKQLKAQVDELTVIVEQLSKEIRTLKQN